jgi:predicted RNA-binding protein (virulence factor B family)
MVSIPKVVSVLSCGLLLGLGLSLHGIHTIKGEVLRVEPSSYFVKQYDGYQVRLHIDETTQMTGRIAQGEHIEAKVNDEHHALSIRQAK